MSRGSGLRTASSVLLFLAGTLAVVAIYAPLLAVSIAWRYRRMKAGFSRRLKRAGLPAELRSQLSSRFGEATSPTNIVDALFRGLSLGARFYKWPGFEHGVKNERGREGVGAASE